ncbi:thioesterase [Sphaerisporangium krabiense]|uniref:Acyl-CoA thioester hydrolase n=1 Tax=Sphaerisporangium krabiense TaxID=763782 RepID=A0A7W8ZA92_9ACTN|nr:thioesterase family protein [Sphaerisporangium krabiense]MBB5630357.1 acyl-CoA thioester hydrolase [Sphaerisporangium krabiense]GII62690.1 thioesterase [Sphaerisporangium krabiense]
MSHTRPVQVHFDDLDAMGLLHNARYGVLVERAISAFWAELGWHFDPARSRFKDVFLAVREFQITYHVPIMGVGEPLVQFWIEHMGTTSGVYGFRVLSPDGETVHAEGRRVNVNLDPATLRPTPFTDETREAAAVLVT